MQQTPVTPEAPQEESIFDESDFDMQEYDKHVRNARIMLFIVAGLELLSLLFIRSDVPSEAKTVVVIIPVVSAAAFVGLAIWTKYRPFPALITALVFYFCIQAAAAFFVPSSIMRGIVLKIAVVTFLAMGIRNAREAMELKKTFGKQ
jgi:hypothetical protein